MDKYPDFSYLNYQVDRELGRNREGGRISYLAHCHNSLQQVVIKQFRFVQFDSSWQGFKAHEREIAILKELNHPRVPHYLESFETNDGFCLVQEYKDAPSLATKNSFQPEEVKWILVSILEILVEIQSRVPIIIHRDIKPENILVDDENHAYLIDFGLARVNSQQVALSSVVAGTPGFMPPETLFSRPLTTASDLYSLGATAIALLTNTPSVEISNLIDENYKFNFSHLVTGINPDFIDWLEKMVEPNPKDRYTNAASALQELVSIDIQGKAKFKPQFQKLTNLRIIMMLIPISIIIISKYFYFLDITSTKSLPSTKSIPPTKNLPSAKKSPPTKSIPPTRKSPSQNNFPSANILTPNQSNISSDQQWFASIRRSCNSREVVTAIAKTNYPQTKGGIGYAATCYALAGRLDLADKVIQELPPSLRIYAAEIIFYYGYSAITNDSDYELAKKKTDLVLKYWPKNYMAQHMPLYVTGMLAYSSGEYSQAKTHLQNFLHIYHRNDGWRNQAKLALSRIEQNIPADISFSVPPLKPFDLLNETKSNDQSTIIIKKRKSE